MKKELRIIIVLLIMLIGIGILCIRDYSDCVDAAAGHLFHTDAWNEREQQKVDATADKISHDVDSVINSYAAAEMHHNMDSIKNYYDRQNRH